MAQSYTRWFTELAQSDRELVGGKCASLGELIRAGVKVPAGFALTTHAYRRFLDTSEVAPFIDNLLQRLDVTDAGAVAAAADEARRVIEAAPRRGDVLANLEEAYAHLSPSGGDGVAVRSSAISEDGETASFAGQQESYLWVRGRTDVVRRTRQCWASLYTPQAITYRARARTAAADVVMSVGVQRMVDAVVAGVTFTVNPMTGDRSVIVINASWGLGVAVVAGEVTPDEYVVSKVTLETIKRRITRKTLEYLHDPGGNGLLSREVSAERQEAACLSDAQLTELVQLAKRVEAHYGGPQDIEWAVDRHSGEILLLQSRPVTAARQAQPPAPASNALDYVLGTMLRGNRK